MSRAVAILAASLFVVMATACGNGDDFSARELVSTGMGAEWTQLDEDQKRAVASRYLEVTGGVHQNVADLVEAADRREPDGSMRSFLRAAAVDAGLASAPTTTQRAGSGDTTTAGTTREARPPSPRTNPRTQRARPPAPAAPEPRPGYTEDSIEYKLAVIDEGFVQLDDPKLNQYRALIDRIRDRCTNGRTQIADQAVTVRNILRDEIGVEEKAIDQLRAFREVSSALDQKRDCTDLFATYVALRVRQGP